MYHRQNDPERDKLRAEFTAWLTTLIRRARLDYLRKTRERIETLSFDELPENLLLQSNDDQIPCSLTEDDFDFEEEWLAKAYAEMPLMQKEILRLLFVEEMKPEFIAKKLNCSPQYVYNQRFKALQKFRQALSEGGDENG